jgi:hypothetical protein
VVSDLKISSKLGLPFGLLLLAAPRAAGGGSDSEWTEF